MKFYCWFLIIASCLFIQNSFCHEYRCDVTSYHISEPRSEPLQFSSVASCGSIKIKTEENCTCWSATGCLFFGLSEYLVRTEKSKYNGAYACLKPCSRIIHQAYEMASKGVLAGAPCARPVNFNESSLPVQLLFVCSKIEPDPAQHAPAQRAPVQRAPAQHAPAQRAPVQRAPANDSDSDVSAHSDDSTCAQIDFPHKHQPRRRSIPHN